MRRPSKEETDYWYGKLKETGFKDIERGKDMNQIPTSTMPGKHCNVFVPWNGNDTDQDLELETASLVNSERAVFWRKVQDEANKLPESDITKSFILDWTETGNYAETGRDYGYTRGEARGIVRAFLASTGLRFDKPPQVEHEPEPEPGPVRRLTKKEIKRLKYKSPREIRNRDKDND